MTLPKISAQIWQLPIRIGHLRLLGLYHTQSQSENAPLNRPSQCDNLFCQHLNLFHLIASKISFSGQSCDGRKVSCKVVAKEKENFYFQHQSTRNSLLRTREKGWRVCPCCRVRVGWMWVRVTVMCACVQFVGK